MQTLSENGEGASALPRLVAAAACDVLSMTAGLEVTRIDCPAVPDETFDGFVGTLSLVGARGGTLVVYCEPSVALAIAGGMLGLDGGDCDEETVRDALGELVNQIAGSIKRALGAGTDMVITVPVVIAGGQMHHYVRTTSDPIAVELGHGGHRLFVCLWPTT